MFRSEDKIIRVDAARKSPTPPPSSVSGDPAPSRGRRGGSVPEAQSQVSVREDKRLLRRGRGRRSLLMTDPGSRGQVKGFQRWGEGPNEVRK